MTKLYIASQYISANQNTTGLYFSTIIEHFRNIFPEMTVIDSQPLFQLVNKEEEYFLAKSAKNNIVARSFSQIIMAVRMIIRVGVKLKSRDIIVTGTNPSFFLPFMILLKKAIGFKWCLILHDVFPDNVLAASILNEKSFIYKILNKIFLAVYRCPDKVIVIGRDMAALVIQKGVAPENIELICNWASENEVAETAKAESILIQSLKWEDEVVFQFFGNIGRLQGIENILNAIKLTENKNLAFLFIGGGAVSSKVDDFITTNKDKKVYSYGPMSLSMKNLGLSSCDVALVSLESGMTGLGVPSKAYFSMAADKPIIAIMEKETEISKVVLENNIGWQCAPGDPELLALLFDGIGKQCILDLKEKPRRVLVEKYSETIAMQKYTACVGSMFDVVDI